MYIENIQSPNEIFADRSKIWADPGMEPDFSNPAVAYATTALQKQSMFGEDTTFLIINNVYIVIALHIKDTTRISILPIVYYK